MKDIVKSLRDLANELEQLEAEHNKDLNHMAENIAGLMFDLSELQEKHETQEYEKGRLEYKIAKQDETISKQREEIGQLKEAFMIAEAILAAVINAVGALDLPQAAVNEALEKKVIPERTYNAENRTYRLRTVKAE